MKRLFMATAAVVLATAIPSQIAAAATSCNYTAGTHRVSVSLVGSVISVISRDTAGHILVDHVWCDGAATVTNTDLIVVAGGLGSQSFSIDLANKGFKPGFTNEPGKSDEIEFQVSLGADTDALTIYGSAKADKIEIGQNNAVLLSPAKINLNSGESTGIDADVSLSGHEIFVVDAKGGNDVISGRGKHGTGPDPYGRGMRVYGSFGNDTIKGGEARDELYGDGGTDKVWGFGAFDKINRSDGAGGDVGYGGDATDTCACDPGDVFNQ